MARLNGEMPLLLNSTTCVFNLIKMLESGRFLGEWSIQSVRFFVELSVSVAGSSRDKFALSLLAFNKDSPISLMEEVTFDGATLASSLLSFDYALDQVGRNEEFCLFLRYDRPSGDGVVLRGCEE